MDTQGLPLGVHVQAASVQDPVGAAPVPAATAAAVLGLRLEVVRAPTGTKGFVVLPQRWVVERSFGWLSKYRWVAGRDYETNPVVSEALIKAYICQLMLRQLGVKSQSVLEYLSGEPASKNYGTSTSRQRPHNAGNTTQYPP